MTLQRLLVAPALLIACAAAAQEVEPAADAPAPPETAAAGGAGGAYQSALASYKDQIRSIEKLWSEYQTADEARQQAINEQLKPQVAGAKEKLNMMVDAAVEAFRADPTGDQQITDLLLSVVEHQVVGKSEQGGGDQYERALPILEALVDGGHEKPELPVWGVMAAVCCNEFDLADKFAKTAIETGAVRATPGDSEEAQATFRQALSYLQEKDRYRERWEEEEKVREADAAADDLPRVRMSIGKEGAPVGEVVIELFEDQAPIATANFVSLVKKGFYDGVVFHRVLPRFMAQGGDPTGTGTGGPGYTIKCECSEPDARQHFRGTLSMAHAGRDTGGSQFFLCFVPTDFLDGRHTAFGRVVEGIETLGEIQVIDPDERGVEPDKILKAEVIRDRGHDYDFPKGKGR